MAVNPPNDPAVERPAGDPSTWTPEQLRAELTRLTRSLEETRREAAAYRVNNRGAVAEATRKLAARAGVEWSDDSPPSLDDLLERVAPERHREELKTRDQTIRGLRLDLGLERAFHEHGVRPTLGRAFLQESGAMSKLAALDPSSETYGDDVAFHVAAAVEAEPGLRDGSTMPPRSSASFTPPQNTQQMTLTDLAGLDEDSVLQALRGGQLDQLLGRR